ncbi:hypothetical protein UFOVP450_130 [uncultured Caudovirales phage]|uniref:Uncharacterized protein n=1 Tax=uncultured Caudovirales phage TaxID=2100421 RepID=A0A6J5MAZ4_9CAUD|nr:hypothetical protein UFOVP450_130 [uncultured Caudovirales phage]
MTALGQPSLSPKRIVYNGDTGIFFIRKQEVALLQIIKQGEGYKKENAHLLDYQMNCDRQLDAERKSYDTLYLNFLEATDLAGEFQTKYEKEWGLHQLTKKELSDEVGRKIRWRKTALWLGVGNLALGGTIFYLIKN